MSRRLCLAAVLLAVLSPGLSTGIASGEELRTLREIENHMSIAERVAIQMALKNAGIYRGEVDALFGTGTRRAIQSFQRSIGVPPTGLLTPEQFERLTGRGARTRAGD